MEDRPRSNGCKCFKSLPRPPRLVLKPKTLWCMKHGFSPFSWLGHVFQVGIYSTRFWWEHITRAWWHNDWVRWEIHINYIYIYIQCMYNVYNIYIYINIIYIYYIYTLQIQNRSFSRFCSNTRGLHTKPEVFQNLIIFEVWLLFWIPCWIKSACWCVFFPGKTHRFCMSDTVGHELAGTTTLATPSTFQKVMCFLPMPLHESRSNRWKSSEISTI